MNKALTSKRKRAFFLTTIVVVLFVGFIDLVNIPFKLSQPQAGKLENQKNEQITSLQKENELSF